MTPPRVPNQPAPLTKADPFTGLGPFTGPGAFTGLGVFTGVGLFAGADSEAEAWPEGKHWTDIAKYAHPWAGRALQVAAQAMAQTRTEAGEAPVPGGVEQTPGPRTGIVLSVGTAGTEELGSDDLGGIYPPLARAAAQEQDQRPVAEFLYDELPDFSYLRGIPSMIGQLIGQLIGPLIGQLVGMATGRVCSSVAVCPEADAGGLAALDLALRMVESGELDQVLLVALTSDQATALRLQSWSSAIASRAKVLAGVSACAVRCAPDPEAAARAALDAALAEAGLDRSILTQAGEGQAEHIDISGLVDLATLVLALNDPEPAGVPRVILTVSDPGSPSPTAGAAVLSTAVLPTAVLSTAVLPTANWMEAGAQ